MPKRPSFASSWITSRGRIPCSNQSPTSGTICSRTNCRTVSRIALSSSSSSASIARKSSGSSATGCSVVGADTCAPPGSRRAADGRKYYKNNEERVGRRPRVAAQRAVLRETVTGSRGTRSAALRRASRRPARRRPARPSRSSRACVVEAGSSSRWCVVIDDRELGLSRARRSSEREQRLAAREVEPRARLVEEEEPGPGDERPRDQRALSLALRAVAEPPLAERPEPERAEEAVGAVEVELREPLLEVADRRRRSGADHLAHGQERRESTRRRARRRSRSTRAAGRRRCGPSSRRGSRPCRGSRTRPRRRA